MIKIAAGQETLEKLLSEEQSNHAKMESRAAETRNKAQMERGLMIKEQRSLNEELGGESCCFCFCWSCMDSLGSMVTSQSTIHAD